MGAKNKTYVQIFAMGDTEAPVWYSANSLTEDEMARLRLCQNACLDEEDGAIGEATDWLNENVCDKTKFTELEEIPTEFDGPTTIITTYFMA